MDRFVREVQKSRLDSEVRAALVSSPSESQELFQKARRASAHSPQNGLQLREVPIPCSPAVALRTCSAARSPRRFPGPPVVAFVARFFERGSTTQLDRRSCAAILDNLGGFASLCAINLGRLGGWCDLRRKFRPYRS